MRNVNICFQDGTYQKIKDLVERRKVSRFVNEAVEAKLQKDEAELRQKLIEGYKKNAKNKKLQKELKVWDETVEDVLGCIDRKESE